jgi:cyanophycinase
VLQGRSLSLTSVIALAYLLFYAGAQAPVPTVGPEKGYLIIVGGGFTAPEVKKRFVDLAGGPDAHFVVIPTGKPDQEIDLDREWRTFTNGFGVKHVTMLHTRDRRRANSAEFVEPLRHASGIWIDGGRQWRLADAYLGTAVENQIKALLARGGVVGGSSAGATIQGSYLIRGDPGNAKNPDGDNRIMMSPGHEVGFGLVTNSAIDQHVIARHREGDLGQVIARHPELLGIGIDEGAAIVVHGDSFEVLTGQVIIHDGHRHGGESYYFLSPRQKFNLRSRAPE